MRTVKVRIVNQVTATMRLEVETEVIVDNDDDATEEGRRAMQVIQDITDGLAGEGLER